VTAESIREIVEAERARRDAAAHRVAVCTAAGCLALGAREVRAGFERAIAGAGLAGSVEVCGTGCLGLCHAGAMVDVRSRGAGGTGRCRYARVTPEVAGRIVKEHLAGGAPVASHRVPDDEPFLARQTPVVLAGSGERDPGRIESCLADGAYAALRTAITERTPHEVLAEVSASGLRGRGGAGYPTGLKWSMVAKAPGARKVVVCNADEGDPGAFMNRSVLEGDPHRVLEGMAIAGYAVGADQGWVYVRGEHPLVVDRIRTAIAQAERFHLLGSRIFDTRFDFRIDLRIGAGAYVCGEETALIASLEGGRGIPRPRPPYPAVSGLHGLPTLVNNVETLANVPGIVANGAAWLARLGSERSKGTKVFALSGRVVHTGLVEVPLGTTLREIVFDIGGGVPGGGRFKAAQTGGPAGGCIPASHLDLPLDYDSLVSIGSFMGSGGLIVLDETDCMVDLARFFVDFCRDESCGKCVPCRAGTVQLHAILDRITRGEGCPEDLARLEELSELLRATSLCGLGQGAPNPVLSTLRWFRDEYVAHVEERRCPAGLCEMGGRAPAVPAVPAGAAGAAGAGRERA
jgi:bidirectional [NiFe] hydrogenase diaphorase subunit